jgi:hypothetical protein
MDGKIDRKAELDCILYPDRDDSLRNMLIITME